MLRIEMQNLDAVMASMFPLVEGERQFDFESTAVSEFYFIYTTYFGAKSLIDMYGSVSTGKWAFSCAATFAQPLARLTGYKKVGTAAGYVVMAASLYANPIPTGFTLVSHYAANKALDYVWRKTPDWYENSMMAKELYALAYVAKSELITYGAKKIEDKLEARRKAKEDEKKKQEEEARRKQEEAKRKKEEEEARKKKDKDDRDKNKQEDDERKAKAAEEEAKQEQAERDAEAAHNAARAAANEKVDGMEWYITKIAEFTKLFDVGFTIKRLAPDNRAFGENLSLAEAIIYFINGGCLIFSGHGKTFIYNQEQPQPGMLYSRTKLNPYVPRDWEDISVSEITNDWFKKLGITSATIVDMVNQVQISMMELKQNLDKEGIYPDMASWIRSLTRAKTSFFIRINNYFRDLFISTFNPDESSKQHKSRKQESCVKGMLITNEQPPRLPIKQTLQAENAVAEAVNVNYEELMNQASSMIFGGNHTGNQNPVDVVVSSSTALQVAVVAEGAEVSQDLPRVNTISAVESRIEADKLRLHKIKLDREAQSEITQSSQAALKAASERLAELKIKMQLRFHRPAMAVDADVLKVAQPPVLRSK